MARTRTTTARTAWPTLPVATLLAHNSPADADADLTADIAAHGILEPLYVATVDDTGAVRVVDGMRRLAAAAAAQLTEAPVTYRPVIRVDALTAHPGNVRADLKVGKGLRASVAVEGIRVPIKVTRVEDGTLRVVDGHRRLEAAMVEGLTHVPYEYDQRDEAGQMLDMVTTATHRESLTVAEEAAALFSAAELGADLGRLAAASGRTQKAARTMIKVGRSAAATAAARYQANHSGALSLETLAQLAELEAADPDAANRVTRAIATNPRGDHEWTITRERRAVEARQQAEVHRIELEAAGARIRTAAELNDKAAPVSALRGVTASAHESCQGHVWVLDSPTDSRYTPYCANAEFFGHETRDSSPAGGEPKRSAAERRAIIEGNRDWDTAEELRRKWITALISRKSHTRAQLDMFTTITARVMLAHAAPMLAKYHHPDTHRMVGQFLGLTQAETYRLNERPDAAPRRNTAHLFAVIAATHEKAAVRTSWRTDGDHGRAQERKNTARWLGWLVELGYQPRPIEAAVLAGEPYNAAAQALADSEAQGDALTSEDDTDDADDE